MDAHAVISASISGSDLGFAPERCVELAGAGQCTRCTDACWASLPAPGAGLLDATALESCTNCLSCVSACPVGAITVPSVRRPHVQRLMDAILAPSSGAPKVVACELVQSPPQSALVVPCLHELGEGLLFLACSTSADGLELQCGGCDTCATASGAFPLLQERIARVQDLLQGLGADAQVNLTEQSALSAGADDPEILVPASPQRGGAAVDRRSALLMIRDQGAHVVRAALGSAAAGILRAPSVAKTVDVAPPLDRILAIRGLRALTTTESHLDLTTESDLIGALSSKGPRISADACTACGDCARFCPTGALRIKHRGDSVVFVLDVSGCVGCGLCEYLCRSDACQIVVRPMSRLLGKPLRLAAFTSKLCSQCGEKFGSSYAEQDDSQVEGSSICPNCERSRNRFPGFY